MIYVSSLSSIIYCFKYKKIATIIFRSPLNFFSMKEFITKCICCKGITSPIIGKIHPKVKGVRFTPQSSIYIRSRIPYENKYYSIDILSTIINNFVNHMLV